MTESKRAPSFSNDDSIEVTIAPNAGACFGVVRAIKLGHAAVGRSRRGGSVFSLGPLIHNPKVVAELEAGGVKTVSDPGLIDENATVILRSHGVVQEVETRLRESGARIVDATCPLVKKPQRIAQSLGQKDYFLVLVGDANHPEVKGVLSYFGRPDFLVTYDPNDVDKIPTAVTSVAVVAQTTIEVRILDGVVERCRARFSDVIVHNTICDATSIRQAEALELARSAEVIVVVGGRNSSNTSKLVKICKEFQTDTHLIEELHELEPIWFRGKRKIGVTGGASTPMEFVDAVGERIVDLIEGGME